MLFFLLCVIALPALAQDQATELLKQIEAKFRNPAPFRVESTYEGHHNGLHNHSWHKRVQRLAYQSPSILRFELSDMSGDFVIAANGETIISSANHLREYVKTALSGAVLDTKPAGQELSMAMGWLRMSRDQFTRMTNNMVSAEFLPDETLSHQGEPRITKVIRTTYKQNSQKMTLERRYWVDADRLLILKELAISTGPSSLNRPYDNSTNINETTHFYPPLEGVTYSFDPPANFVAVDKIEPWMMRMRNRGGDLLNKPAPEIAAKLLSGDAATLSAYKGKLVLLDFWATWCEPCRAQMPAISKLYSETKEQGLVLLGVNADESTQTAIDYITEHKYDWTHFHDDKHKIRDNYGISGIPTLVLIDREGKVVASEVGSGPQSDSNIRQALRKQGLTLD